MFFFAKLGVEFQVFAKYVAFALEIAQGGDIGQRVLDASPLYLGVMTAVARYAPQALFYMPLIQLGLGVGVCLMIYALGVRLFNVGTGFVAGLLYAMYGNGMVLESTLEPFVFVLLFNAITVFLLLPTREDAPVSRLRILAAGVFSGLSVLAKPNFLLFLPMGAAWLFFLGKRTNRKMMIAAPLLYIAAAMAVISPVTIRNYVRFNDFVLVTADYGKVFFHGNAWATTVFIPQYLPGQDIVPPGESGVDYPHTAFRKKAAELAGRPLLPSEAADFWMRTTLRDIAKHPWKHLQLEGKKLVLFFHDFEIHEIQTAHWQSRRSMAYAFLHFGIISSLGLLGMALCFRDRKRLALVYGVFLAYLASCLIFVVNSRYRGPAVPWLCLFAGAAFQYTAGFFAQKKYRAFAASMAILAVLLAFTHLTYSSQVQQHLQLIKTRYPETGVSR